MSYGGPRRTPPNDQQRRNSSLVTHATQSLRGRTYSARPNEDRARRVQDTPVDGQGVIAVARFIDGAVGPSVGLTPHVSQFGGLTGDGDLSWCEIGTPAGGSVPAQINEPGWYSTNPSAIVIGAANAKIEAVIGIQWGICVGYGTDIDGLIAQAASEVFYVYEADLPVAVEIQVTADSSGPYVTEAVLSINRWNGPVLPE